MLALLARLLATVALPGDRDRVISATLAPSHEHIVNRIAFSGLDGKSAR